MSERTIQKAEQLAGHQQLTATPTVKLVPGTAWRLIQLSVDFVTIFLAGMATYGLYLISGLGRRDYDPLLYSQLNLAVAVVTLFAMIGFGVYRNQLGLLKIEAIRGILLSVGAGLTLTLTLTFLVKFPAFSRLTLAMLGPVLVFTLVTQRFVMWKIQGLVRSTKRYSKTVLVYGAGATGKQLAQYLLEEYSLGLRPIGFLDDDTSLLHERLRVGAGRAGARIPVLGTETDLSRVLRSTGATAVFLAMPSATAERIAELGATLERMNVRYFFVPSAGNLMFSGLQFGQVAGMPVFSRRVQKSNRAYEAAKRLLDLGGALSLLVLSLPLLLISALLIRLTTRGPVLFSQTRCGLNGAPFTIYKLRTMCVDAPKYALHPDSPQDARITRVGRWLRTLSIDELPQLYNVLRGEMSLVGPRPEMPGVVARYSDIQRQRLVVKPGVTGLWQISADRAFLIHDNIQYDLHYIEHRTFSLDLAILIMTPLVLAVGGRNGAM